MINLKFLGYIAKQVGEKEIKLHLEDLSVRSVLDYIWSRHPHLKDDFVNNEIIVIADGKTLVIPDDEERKVDKELVLVPIIEGGNY